MIASNKVCGPGQVATLQHALKLCACHSPGVGAAEGLEEELMIIYEKKKIRKKRKKISDDCMRGKRRQAMTEKCECMRLVQSR